MSEADQDAQAFEALRQDVRALEKYLFGALILFDEALGDVAAAAGASRPQIIDRMERALYRSAEPGIDYSNWPFERLRAIAATVRETKQAIMGEGEGDVAMGHPLGA